MINYEESFLNNIEFGNTESRIVGGYVYKAHSKNEAFYGGTNQRDVTVPVGLLVNKHNDNIKCYGGEYVGVIGIDRINDFLDLNHKSVKRITRKFKSIVNQNRTKRNNI